MDGNDFLNLEDLIHEIRGKQVMFDSDLARLYGCKNGTKDINKAMKRHLERFPKDFCFQLEPDEYDSLRFQNGTLKSGLRFQNGTSKNKGGRRYLPYVFTEQGVAMLATVLKTDVAAEASIAIMRAFVAMKKYISSGLIEQKYINEMVVRDHEKIKLLASSFQKFEEKKKDMEIYFDGQIYDAYSKIFDIFSQANNNLIIIDAYASKTILDIIRRLGARVTIITGTNSPLSRQDKKKYAAQYNNLQIIYNNTFHDRYFILDNTDVYHCGASVNGIGKKTFSITRVGDKEVCDTLMSKISKIMI